MGNGKYYIIKGIILKFFKNYHGTEFQYVDLLSS